MFGCSNEEVSWVGVGDLILLLIINNIFYTNMIDPIHPDLLPVFTFGVCCQSCLRISENVKSIKFCKLLWFMARSESRIFPNRFNN